MLRQAINQTANRHVLSQLRGRMYNRRSRYSAIVSSLVDMRVPNNNDQDNNNDDCKTIRTGGPRLNNDRAVLLQVRNFGLSRRPDQKYDRAPDDDMEDDDNDDITKLKTSDDMDFYDSLTDDFQFDDDEEEDDGMLKQEEEEEKKRQAVRDELDSRTGRLWSDPWEITDEDWMSSSTTIDSLPDWTEDVVSRISKEKVKLYAGK